MARFLSPEWFAALGAATGDETAALTSSRWVIEQVVTGAPEGDVRYQVIVDDGGTTRIHAGAGATPTVTFTSAYPTAAAIARGELSTHGALMDGRVRVSGDLGAMADALGHVVGTDLVPDAVRDSTTY